MNLFNIIKNLSATSLLLISNISLANQPITLNDLDSNMTYRISVIGDTELREKSLINVTANNERAYFEYEVYDIMLKNVDGKSSIFIVAYPSKSDSLPTLYMKGRL